MIRREQTTGCLRAYSNIQVATQLTSTPSNYPCHDIPFSNARKMADIAPPESMDEINAQRIAAGLAPIGMTDSGGDEEPAVDEDIVAAQNYAKRKEEAKRAKAEQDTKERIAK